ncbi:hypothetical protein CN354_20800 [Bacillus cereus]|nr:hypothetical protein CN354_20800 [Bacillus cereus]
MRLTPREFHLLLEEAKEMQHDEMEKLAIQAILVRSAVYSKKKKLQSSDLIKRKSDESKAEEHIEDLKEKFSHQQEWLNQFNFGTSQE